MKLGQLWIFFINNELILAVYFFCVPDSTYFEFLLSSVVFVAELSVRLRSTLLSVPGGVYGGGKDGGIEKGLRPSRVKISKIVQTFEKLISNIFWSQLAISSKFSNNF